MSDEAAPDRPPVGTTIQIDIPRDDPCPYIVVDNTLVSHIVMTHQAVGVEVSLLRSQNFFQHQLATVVGYRDDGSIEVKQGPYAGMSHAVHKATLRMSPLTALDTAAALLEHMVKNGLVDHETMAARFAVAGITISPPNG